MSSPPMDFPSSSAGGTPVPNRNGGLQAPAVRDLTRTPNHPTVIIHENCTDILSFACHTVLLDSHTGSSSPLAFPSSSPRVNLSAARRNNNAGIGGSQLSSDNGNGIGGGGMFDSPVGRRLGQEPLFFPG